VERKPISSGENERKLKQEGKANEEKERS